jgi:hypothetical protein
MWPFTKNEIVVISFRLTLKQQRNDEWANAQKGKTKDGEDVIIVPGKDYECGLSWEKAVVTAPTKGARIVSFRIKKEGLGDSEEHWIFHVKVSKKKQTQT